MKKINEFFSNTAKSNHMKLRFRIILICCWILILTICIINRDKITVDEILKITPDNMALAIILFLIMFALKSVTVVIYCGLIYIASGVVFPLPLAFAVNAAGTAVMVSIPYFIGRCAGNDIVKNIIKKYPKAEEIQSIQIKNEFFLSFIIRIIGLLPSDPISAYMGAVGIDYKKYLAGTMLGMLPSVITFPIMGMNITNPASPAFIISALFELCVSIISIRVYSSVKKRKRM